MGKVRRTLNDRQRNFLKLIDRSMKGRPWATVSSTLWNMSQDYARQMPELVELHPSEQKIRLTDDGEVLVNWT